MLLYNTTYHIEEDKEKLFLNWAHECLIPEVQKDGVLSNIRLLRVLSRIGEDDGVTYAIQMDVQDSATLHKWYQRQGASLLSEMQKIFKHTVMAMPTLMEIVC